MSLFLFFAIIFVVFNFSILVLATFQCAVLKNPFGRCHLGILGSFVWGDAVIFSVFWIIVGLLYILYVKNIYFFLFCSSVFYAVRGFGETVYWLNQQFSKINRNPPEGFLIHKVFPGESVWFVYQITWQTITVFAIISSVFFGFKWLSGQ